MHQQRRPVAHNMTIAKSVILSYSYTLPKYLVQIKYNVENKLKLMRGYS